VNGADVAQRVALGWGRAYTRTAPEPDRSARRAELAADVHDQLADARARGMSEHRLARTVIGRVVRGVAADLAWRLDLERTPARLDWHLAHPGTLLAVLFTILVPTTLLADAARGPVSDLGPYLGLFASLVVLVSGSVIVFAAVAPARRLVRGEPLLSGPTVRGVRRAALSAMCVLWAGAALWRFTPESAGWAAQVSALSWAGFGLALVVYLGCALVSGVQAVRLVDNRKVSS
jgi:phage shock protein PspC (stress-responsive transcriptional regulator)